MFCLISKDALNDRYIDNDDDNWILILSRFYVFFELPSVFVIFALLDQTFFSHAHKFSEFINRKSHQRQIIFFLLLLLFLVASKLSQLQFNLLYRKNKINKYTIMAE